MSVSAQERVRTILRHEISRLKEGEIAPEEIRDDLLLFDVNEDGAENLGLDSLDALEIVMSVEEQYDVSLPSDVDFKELSTVNDIVAFVVRLSDEGQNGTG